MCKRRSELVLCMQVLLLIGTVAAGAWPPAMYVFGSSILDVGNNNYLSGAAVGRANRPHNGVDFPGSIPTGRFSNGYNIADYVAKNMGFACSPPAYLSLLAPNSGPLVQAALANGVSYASGGAGILDSTNAGNTIPLSKQVQFFRTTKTKMVATVGPHAVNEQISRSIFLMAIGNNDMLPAAERGRNMSAAGKRMDAAALYASLLSNYSAAVADLHSMGAKRFAIINVGPEGCLPGARVLRPAGACMEDLNRLAAGFNAALRSWLAGGGLGPGLVYSLADCFGFMRDVVDDPPAFEFTDVTTACCGSGRLGAEAECFPNSTVCADHDQHVFWDHVHFSQRTSYLMAQAFYNGPAKYTAPINFMQLARSKTTHGKPWSSNISSLLKFF